MIAEIRGPAFNETAMRVYREALTRLCECQVPFLVAGAYALQNYTGIARHTKDLDIFVRRDDSREVLDALESIGWRTEVTYPHWLAKGFFGELYLDVIFNSGNGICPVDDEWFAHATDVIAFGLQVKLSPPEEMLWQKMFIMSRERYDGADVLHIIRTVGHRLDWHRVLWRMRDHARLLLSHLLLFGYVYPADRAQVPQWVLDQLLEQVRNDSSTDLAIDPDEVTFCRGTLLSATDYLHDVDHGTYVDPRLPPYGNMAPAHIDQWTTALLEHRRPDRPIDPLPAGCRK